MFHVKHSPWAAAPPLTPDNIGRTPTRAPRKAGAPTSFRPIHDVKEHRRTERGGAIKHSQ